MDLDKIYEQCALAKKLASQKDIVSQCLRDLESLGSGYKAYLNGSRAVGLTADPASDVDVFLDTGDMFDGVKNQHSDDLGNVVYKVEAAIRGQKKFVLLSSLHYCRSPIIKARHISSSLNCDVTFRHGMGVENTQLLLHLMNIAPIVRPLILFLKERVKANSALKTYFGSYTLYMLVIFYMQQKNYLPSVVRMRSVEVVEKKVGGWDCHFSKSLEIMKELSKADDLVELISGFAEFYLGFDFKSKVVCPSTGSFLLNSQFDNNGATLPNDMKVYKNMVNAVTQSQRNSNKQGRFLWTHPKYEVFRNDSCICIQDIFDLSHNLTKAWKMYDLYNFKSLLNEILQQCSRLHHADKEKWQNIDWSI